MNTLPISTYQIKKPKTSMRTIRPTSVRGILLVFFVPILTLVLVGTLHLAQAEINQESSIGSAGKVDSEEAHSPESDHGHSHGEDTVIVDDHGHAHGSEGERTAQITVWGERFEIFLEHTYIVAGEPTPFVTHVTDLQKLVPRKEGPIEFVLRFGSELPIGRIAKAPVRDGIYIPELIFPKSGTWDVSIVIPVDNHQSIVKLPPIEVYDSSKDYEHVPKSDEIEGITFLKEQQWKFPFETLQFSDKDGKFFIPEQAIANGDPGPIVFVHVTGETVQPRVVEIETPKDGRVEVLSGLQDGDRVVVRGTDAILVSSVSASEEGHAHGVAEEVEGNHGHEHGSANGAHEDAGHPSEGPINLSAEMRANLNLTTSVVGNADLALTLDVYGWVRPLKENMTEVRTPLAGTVKEILATPGMQLQKGDPIVKLQSREVLAWQQTILKEGNRRKTLQETKVLVEAEGRAKLVELLGGLRVDSAELNRISKELDLIEKAGTGAVAQREINTVKGQLESARASLHSKQTLAEAYGLTSEMIAKVKSGNVEVHTREEDLPPDYKRQLREMEFDLQSSLTEEKIAVSNLRSVGFEEGQLDRLMKGDSDAVVNTITLHAENPFLVTDLLMKTQSFLNLGDPILSGIDYSEVLIDAEIPEVEINQVLSRATDKTPIRIPALDNQSFEAEVLFFDTTVHAGDRKAHLVLKLKNTESLALRDGMAASVGIPIEIRTDTMTVPKESILTDGLEKIVFVAENNTYRKQSITIGVSGFESTEVLSGLAPGQQVVVSGAPALLLSLKSQEGSLVVGHGHAH